MIKTIFLIVGAIALTGCAASPDYVHYTKTQEAIATARGVADAAKYKAMADIAATGDSAAKVAAVMAIALGQGTSSQQPGVAPPQNQALQWASILIPSLTQIYGIRANADVAMRSSDNAAATSIATTQGFVSLAGKIQAPGATTNTTISGNSGANSGDATATPTVVNQPAPVIVTQPAPVIVTQPAPTVVNPVVVPAPAPVIVTQPAPVIVQPSYPPAAR